MKLVFRENRTFPEVNEAKITKYLIKGNCFVLNNKKILSFVLQECYNF